MKISVEKVYDHYRTIVTVNTEYLTLDVKIYSAQTGCLLEHLTNDDFDMNYRIYIICHVKNELSVKSLLNFESDCFTEFLRPKTKD